MKRIPLVVAALVLAACGSKSPQTQPSGSSTPGELAKAVDAPAVSAPGVLATDDSAPPVIVLIDTKGQRSLAAAASWKDVAAGKWSAGPKAASEEASWMSVREAVALGKDAKGTVEGFEDFKTELDTRTNPNGAQDDPPPPEEEDKPDDGEDESGGTGTAMALDEGKMGKKDSDRAEGQYKMQKNQDDPQLARQQAIEAARAAGILGNTRSGFADAMDDEVARQISAQGVVTSEKMDHVPAVVIANPSTKATMVIHAVSEMQAMIGVKSGAEIRPLRIQFHHRGGRSEASSWLEVRLESSGLTIEAVPSKAATVTWAEAAGKLKGSLAEARDKKHIDATAPVDVLVAGDVDTQHLVDVLVALDGAGVTTIGLGDAPTGKQLALRGHEPEPKSNKGVPTVAIGNPNAQGDLDKAIIRRYVKRNIQKIQYCYEKELLAKPRIKGTVQVQFLIKPDGKVKQSTASGVDPAVATCVAAVIKDIEFPKPKGGGNVQVNYPFTFRPEEPKKP